jgi:hypothetical protein
VNCEIAIRADYTGPTLLELEPVLETTEGTVEVRWEGTSAELATLCRYPKRKFILIVNDLSSMERTASITGKRLVMEKQFLDNAKLTLISRKSYNWRFTVDDVGLGVARAALTKLSADSIRLGKKPILAPIISDVLCDGVSSLDTDVLLRLRVMRG